MQVALVIRAAVCTHADQGQPSHEEDHRPGAAAQRHNQRGQPRDPLARGQGALRAEQPVDEARRHIRHGHAHAGRSDRHASQRPAAGDLERKQRDGSGRELLGELVYERRQVDRPY